MARGCTMPFRETFHHHRITLDQIVGYLTEAIVADARVPYPLAKFTQVGQIVESKEFILWPKYLVDMVCIYTI